MEFCSILHNLMWNYKNRKITTFSSRVCTLYLVSTFWSIQQYKWISLGPPLLHPIHILQTQHFFNSRENLAAEVIVFVLNYIIVKCTKCNVNFFVLQIYFHDVQAWVKRRCWKCKVHSMHWSAMSCVLKVMALALHVGQTDIQSRSTLTSNVDKYMRMRITHI